MSGVVIIAGGGTGGHIYPGVAVAREIERRHPSCKVHFVGASGGLEEKIVPREGFPLHTVPIGRLHRSVGLRTRLITLLKMPLAFFVACRLLFKLKPKAVLGVGGFASGPMLFVASIFGFRTLIWEPNAHPGLANRLLARFVDECLVVFESAGKILGAKKTTPSGLPVRSIMKPVPRNRGRSVGMTASESLKVFVFGGSQGARFINETVSEAMKLGGWLSGVELVHQTGPHDFHRMKEFYADAPSEFQIYEYIHDMDRRYAWADLVICRAGASTVAEVAACEKAAIFIPLPTAADDHQRKNAEALVRAEAAMMFLQNELTPEKLRETIEKLRSDRSSLAKMEENVKRFQFPDAATKIVERLLENT